MILRLFGTLAVQVNGRTLPPLSSRKGYWLLALLALKRGTEMDRASLAGLLWPASTHTPALYNLRRALAELREVLGPESPRLTSPHLHTLALDLTGAEVDLLAFDAALAQGDEESLEHAVGLYRGPLLEGCAEAWILPERLHREQAYLEALEILAGHALARGDSETALCRLRQAVATDPFRESAQQALLKALIASGDTLGALLAYRDFRLRLYDEIRAEPPPEMKALFQQLHAQARRRAKAEESARRTVGTAVSPAVPKRLPSPISPFVGRETERRAVEDCLEFARLVTLTGPGGVGKTRLAIQVAEAIAHHHLDGVWFVDLASISEPALVAQAVAKVLAVQEQPDRPLIETLAGFLGPRQLLMILDNCEHLLSTCAQLAKSLLSHCPELRVLATSRQSLGIAGEVVWQLPGMSVPPGVLSCADLKPGALMRFEAVRLFVERGTQATTSFALTQKNARFVAAVCRRLDGIPLAIELAAARLNALSAEEIAARLDDCFHLLTVGSRTAQPRHQTLRATMDWSYDLLSPAERLLLQRLSVFAGSCTLEAVAHVCTGSRVASHQVLDLLTALVDQSLVVVERADDRRNREGISSLHAPTASGSTGTRYSLLETVRQYALERQCAEARYDVGIDEETARRRHWEHFSGLAAAAGPNLSGGPDQAAWLERFEIDLDNLRAALDWAQECEPEGALTLAVGLTEFCIQRGFLEEGRHRLAQVLERAGSKRQTPAGALALFYRAYLCFLGDDFPTARSLYEESLSIRRSLGDPSGIAAVLWGIGHVTRRQKAYSEARGCFEESLAIGRELGDRFAIAQSLVGLGDTLREAGDSVSVWASCYEKALELYRELGDRPEEEANALGRLAHVAWQQGDHARARLFRTESLTLWRVTGSRLGVMHALGALGHLAREEGDYEDARAFYTESLLIRREVGDLFTMIQGLEDFAELAAAESEWERMARLLGAAEALRKGMGRPLQPRERDEYERYLGRSRHTLGEETVAAAWEAGRAMSPDQAFAFALGF